MKFKNKIMCLLIICLVAFSSFTVVSASMEIEGGCFSTDGGLEDLTYATIYVGEEYSGDDIIIQIYYSRDGSLLNHGNMVPKTVDSDGNIHVKSADAYKYFPDHAEINLYDTSEHLLDSKEVNLSPSSGKQTFGIGDFDDTSSSSTGSSHSGGSTYHTGTSSSYIGNSQTGKFHAPGCGDVDKMDNANKVAFSSRSEAISAGYSPCGHCHP